MKQGPATGTPTIIASKCPANYVLIPKHEGLGVNEDFCVMKYEARAQQKETKVIEERGCNETCSKNWASDSDTSELKYSAVSSTVGSPWRSLTIDAAKTACSELGGKYSLISNNQWMAIAHTIEGISSNWYEYFDSASETYVRALNQGWNHNPVSNDVSALNPAPSSSDECLYLSLNYTCASSGDSRERRTHVINAATQEVIWDVAGNVWEFVDWTIVKPEQKASKGTSTGFVQFKELNKNIGENSDDEMTPVTWQALDPDLDSANGIGRYRRSGNTQNVMYRGGRLDSRQDGGIYALYADVPTTGNHSIGFRCVYLPE